MYSVLDDSIVKASWVGAYAFWRYDQFPYVLGGEITKELGTLSFEVHGYEGMIIHPIAMMPKEEGALLCAKLDRLTLDYQHDRKALHDRYVELLNNVKKW